MGEQVRVQHVVHAGVVGVPVQQVDRPGQHRQQHVQVMGHHLDGHAQTAVELCQQVDGGALPGQVQIGQGLVQHEQIRIADQGLGDGHPLSQAAGELGQAQVGPVLHTDEAHGLSGALAVLPGDGVNAEPGAGQPQQDGLFGRQVGVDVRGVALGYVADAVVGLAGRLPQDPQAAGVQGEQAQLGLHHAGLAGAVGAHDGGHGPRGNGEGPLRPDQPPGSADGGMVEDDAGLRGCAVRVRIHGFLSCTGSKW